jgi:hypothetical protein
MDRMDDVRMRCWLVAAMVFGVMMGCASTRDMAWSHYDAGLESYHQADWTRSEAQIEAAIATGFALPGLHADYAVLLARQGRHDEARAHLALELQHHPESHMIVARVLALLDEGEREGGSGE